MKKKFLITTFLILTIFVCFWFLFSQNNNGSNIKKPDQNEQLDDDLMRKYIEKNGNIIK